jgi:hypothetical protein
MPAARQIWRSLPESACQPSRAAANLARGLQTIHTRHLYIHQDQVIGAGPSFYPSDYLQPIGGSVHPYAHRVQQFCGDLTAHQLSQSLGNRQPQAGTAIATCGGWVNLLKDLKQPALLRQCHTNAGVGHFKAHLQDIVTILKQLGA